MDTKSNYKIYLGYAHIQFYTVFYAIQFYTTFCLILFMKTKFHSMQFSVCGIPLELKFWI